jgi:hypothetical protein
MDSASICLGLELSHKLTTCRCSRSLLWERIYKVVEDVFALFNALNLFYLKFSWERSSQLIVDLYLSCFTFVSCQNSLNGTMLTRKLGTQRSRVRNPLQCFFFARTWVFLVRGTGMCKLWRNWQILFILEHRYRIRKFQL